MGFVIVYFLLYHHVCHLLSCFRLFSEGGNYCPEEIEVFSKKLVST